MPRTQKRRKTRKMQKASMMGRRSGKKMKITVYLSGGYRKNFEVPSIHENVTLNDLTSMIWPYQIQPKIPSEKIEALGTEYVYIFIKDGECITQPDTVIYDGNNMNLIVRKRIPSDPPKQRDTVNIVKAQPSDIEQTVEQFPRFSDAAPTSLRPPRSGHKKTRKRRKSKKKKSSRSHMRRFR